MQPMHARSMMLQKFAIKAVFDNVSRCMIQYPCPIAVSDSILGSFGFPQSLRLGQIWDTSKLDFNSRPEFKHNKIWVFHVFSLLLSLEELPQQPR